MQIRPFLICSVFGLFVAAALTAMMGAEVRADYRLFDDFQDKLLGPVGGQDGWMSGSVNIAVVADPDNPDNQCLYVPSESSILRKSLGLEYVGVLNGTTRMLFMRLRVSRKQTFSVGLSHLTWPSEFSDLKTFYIKTAGGASGVNFGPVYLDDICLELSHALNLSNPTAAPEPIPGDANRDGCVNLADAATVAAYWMAGPMPAATWEEGNFDYDDAVNLADLHLLAMYWLVGCAPM